MALLLVALEPLLCLLVSLLLVRLLSISIVHRLVLVCPAACCPPGGSTTGRRHRSDTTDSGSGQLIRLNHRAIVIKPVTTVQPCIFLLPLSIGCYPGSPFGEQFVVSRWPRVLLSFRYRSVHCGSVGQ